MAWTLKRNCINWTYYDEHWCWEERQINATIWAQTLRCIYYTCLQEPLSEEENPALKRRACFTACAEGKRAKKKAAELSRMAQTDSFTLTTHVGMQLWHWHYWVRCHFCRFKRLKSLTNKHKPQVSWFHTSWLVDWWKELKTFSVNSYLL